jgi:hypothetical protein
MSKIKKQNILPIPPQFDKSRLQTVGHLPNTESVNKSVADLTQKPKPVKQAVKPVVSARPVVTKVVAPIFEEPEMPTRLAGRPKKLPSEGRITYNTMIRDGYVMDLKIMAAQKRVSVADLLEEALNDFFAKHSAPF